ncbi:DUF748 domain-containing protein [Maribacter polysiphoniae]|uniref:DUF748 domain-containing protein n=1 Tax=Maribacter polysiphoniae TaxID=429344 RepID=A0A316E1I8_9FLAO|nr:DUF748 domain-containing protein [Maribacter polysiphoniae]MBD1260541.1 DUF748 domain-containing protein [Maribacter polysiphoniae]PWK24334.1 uncharacterized protein DUF748 [Maribacter polysiphoniae]
MKKKENRGIRKKRYLLPILVICLLITLRLLLPFVVKNYVNNVLADLPGYYGQVSDIDISIYRGAYVIHDLFLNKIDAGSQVPFIDLEKTDISIEWSALFKGKVVSEIVMSRPQFIYVFEDHQNEKAVDPDLEDWTKALTDLVPIDINNLKIVRGKAAFVQLNAEPNIDLYLNEIELNATNLRNVVRTENELPSQINATAVSIGQGTFKLEGKMDLVKQIPDMDISFSLQEASAKALNDFTNHYAGIDFVDGNLNVFSEMAIANGYLTGYVKPLLKDLKLVDPEQDKFLNILWEGFVGFFKFILKNKGNNTLATKVPLQGDLNHVETKVWPTIWNVFKNGWVKAFKGVIDNDVNFEDAEKGAKNTK